MPHRWSGIVVGVFALALLGGCMAGGPAQPGRRKMLTVPPTPAAVIEEPLRVFWVNSWGSGDRWAQQVRTGIWEALARAGYGLVEETLVWEAHHLDMAPATPADVTEANIDAALAALVAFEPDVVILSDDEAFEAIAPHFPQGQMQIVVCGADASVASGWLQQGAGAMLGGVMTVVEQLHPMQTVLMAREFTGGSGDYLLVGDGSSSGTTATRAAHDSLVREYGESVPYWGTADSWEAWKSLVLAHMDDVDFILISSYQPLPDAGGQPVDSRAMMAWMLTSSPVPVFALSSSVVVDGAVGGLVVDGYEQGRLAGEFTVGIARDTRVSGDSGAVGYNRLVLNAAAARHWGLGIPTLFPIAAEVYSSVPVLQSGTPKDGGHQ